LTNGLIDAGSKLGPALGTLIGGLVVARYGWRALFLGLGLGALPWLLPWAAFALPVKVESAEEIRDRVGYLQILRQRSAWGTFLGLFAINSAWYFSLMWLPSYLVMERHFSLKTMAILGSLPFWALAVSATLSGWLSDHLIARGASVTRVRKTFAAAGLLLLGGFILPAAVVPDHRAAIALLIAGFFSFGLTTSNHWAITQTLAGPMASGRWTGVQNAIGNLAGGIVPTVTGLIVEKTGSFYLAFVAVCVVLVLGAIGFVFVVGPIAPVFKAADRAASKLP
jgi:MFS family permease